MGWVILGIIALVVVYVASTGYVVMTDEAWGILLVWLVLAGLVALLARSQGRSPVTWFLLAVMLSPVFAFLAAVLSQSPKDRARRRQ